MTGQIIGIDHVFRDRISFLAALSVLIVAPLVHGRAERLTTLRLEATIPLSMAEVQRIRTCSAPNSPCQRGASR